MSEHFSDDFSDHPQDQPGPEGDGPAAVESTGHPDVDDVIGSLNDLDDRPVDEHVAVFETAHDRLRSALADAGNDPSGS